MILCSWTGFQGTRHRRARLSKSTLVDLEKKMTRFIPQTKVWGFLAYMALKKILIMMQTR
jgi:cytochrome c oxidase assembly protein Cox11